MPVQECKAVERLEHLRQMPGFDDIQVTPYAIKLPFSGQAVLHADGTLVCTCELTSPETEICHKHSCGAGALH